MNKLKNKNYVFEEGDLESEGFIRKSKKKNKNYGVILSFLFSISNEFFKLLKNGFFGYLFADMYTKCNQKWKKGAIYGIFKTKRRVGRGRLYLARLYEESLIARIISWFGKRIRNSYMRFWGLIFFSFGCAVTFVSMFKYYLIEQMDQGVLIIGIAMAVISLPFLTSKSRLGEALLKGKLSRYIIVKMLSLDEGKFESDETVSGGSYSLAFSIAALLGFTTYFIHPWAYVGTAICVVMIAVIMTFPELCIMTIISIVPFANVFKNPSAAIFALLVFAIIGYVLKFIRGKRVLRFELIDAFILAFAFLYLCGGIFTRGGERSLYSAIVYVVFMSIYFLISNSFIRKTWIYRGIKLIVVLTSIIAVVGILEGGVINASWVDMEIFNDIGPRVSSFLGNPNMLGVYLVIVFPFALAQMLLAHKNRDAFGYSICVIILIACTILTWSRGAWLGLIVATLLFALIYDTRMIWAIITCVASLPIWYTVLPQSIINRFISIFTLEDSSVIYRLNTWRGVWAMIKDNLLVGVGVGESAFKEAYEIYAVSGTESVIHSHSIFLQITLELGILGIAIFGIIMMMYMQKCFVIIKSKDDKIRSKTMIAAGFAGIVGSLVAGITDHIWYNYRVFLLFWIVMGLTVAMTKINEKEIAKKEAASVSNIRSADLDIDIY